MIEALHTGMMANVSAGGEFSETFGVTNGIKQSYVLAPMLFSIFLSAILDESFQCIGYDVYRQSADLLKVTYFRDKTKTIQVIV